MCVCVGASGGVKKWRDIDIELLMFVHYQLTCMYNYIKGDADVTSYDLFPPDVLLYYE